MKYIKLSNRLQAAAGFIKQGANVADIGTDHGYLPVYLAQNNIAQRIIAADINKGPLARAKASAEEFAVAERIEFVLTDGLAGLEGVGIDTVVIAGMGGETMISILEKALWTCEDTVSCILQPQTKLDELVKWLAENGFAVFDATLAKDEGRLYEILLVGKKTTSLIKDPLRILMDKRDALMPAYLTKLCAISQRVAEAQGLSAGSARAEELDKKRALEALLRLKEETDTWQQ